MNDRLILQVIDTDWGEQPDMSFLPSINIRLK